MPGPTPCQRTRALFYAEGLRRGLCPRHIGRALGVAPGSVAGWARRRGLRLPDGRSAPKVKRARIARLRAQARSPEGRAQRSEFLRARWRDDPEFAREMRAWLRAARHVGANRMRHLRRLPPEDLETYRFLTKRKSLRRAEAMAVLGRCPDGHLLEAR